MDAAAIALAGLAGLLFGSFANVVVWRVPRRESIVRPGSYCPGCETPLTARENVPVVSWLAQRGRCRHCRAPIAWRYPAIELLTGALFAIAAALLRPTDLIAYLPVLWVLVVLSFIDLEHKILPNRIVLPSVAVGLVLFAVAAALGPGYDALLRGALAGLAGSAFLLLLALVWPGGMGMGDVKLALLLGLALGYLPRGWGRLFVGFMLAFVAGSLGGVALILARRGGLKSQVPFGPYLALGTVVAIFWGGALVRFWLGG